MRKLIGGSLSRGRKANSRPSENEGGDKEILILEQIWRLALCKNVCGMIVYCIVYRYLCSASHGVSQTEALSVHFSSRKNLGGLKARERDEDRGAEKISERR